MTDETAVAAVKQMKASKHRQVVRGWVLLLTAAFIVASSPGVIDGSTPVKSLIFKAALVSLVMTVALAALTALHRKFSMQATLQALSRTQEQTELNPDQESDTNV